MNPKHKPEASNPAPQKLVIILVSVGASQAIEAQLKGML